MPRGRVNNEGGVNAVAMQVSTPREMGRVQKMKITFASADLKLTWLDFFLKHSPALAKFLQRNNGFVVHDHRGANRNMQVWTLKHTIKEYINSFKKTMQLYLATVAKQTDRLVPNSPPVRVPVKPAPNRNSGRTTANVASAGTSSHQPGPSAPNTGPRNMGPPNSPVKRPATSTTNGGPQAKSARTDQHELHMHLNNRSPQRASGPVRPILNPNSFLNTDQDDTASMANSIASQDSQLEELAEQGVEIKDIRNQIVKNILKHVDNVTMLKMKNEMQTLMDSGKWLRLAGRLPITASTLQFIFFDLAKQ